MDRASVIILGRQYGENFACFVDDFFDEEGNVYDYETIEDYFWVNIDSLTFFGLRRAILSVNHNF